MAKHKRDLEFGPLDEEESFQQSQIELLQDLTPANISDVFAQVQKNVENREQMKRKKALDQNIQEIQDPKKITENLTELQSSIEPLIQKDKAQSELERQGFKKEAIEDVTKELPGLTPKQRRSLQETANSQINSQVQNYKRILGSSAGRKGIRGGAALAPQMELAKQGLNAQNQFQRDLVEKDSDIALRRLAAYLSNIEGRSAEQVLRRGQYLDYITGRQQQGKEEAYKNYFENLFSRVKK